MTQQYQVLARKYRPKNFHELIGQTHVSQALINAIDYNRLHHAYLFTGTRGVGKTTIARILAKCLNCDTGITSTPCGVCDNCVSIDQGRFIDLIEIDAASRTKVEDTRELLDNVPYAPSQGRYKVYLIDEVHMLSTHSFNALLKTLEEPPEHVKFLLATTDPQKLPITIISRCLQFVLRPLSQSLLSEYLATILTKEQVDFTQPALWQLASAAKGSVRDALSLTDQAIAFGQGALDDVTVNDMLGLIDAADLVRLIMDIYNHDKSAVAAHIEQMRAQMVDAGSMFDGLAELLHQLALTQLLPDVALNVNESQAQNINNLAQHISPDVLQLYYEIVVQAREGIKLASTPMQALEMCILRLLAFRPLPVDEILATPPTSPLSTSITVFNPLDNNGISDNENNASYHHDAIAQTDNKPSDVSSERVENTPKSSSHRNSYRNSNDDHGSAAVKINSTVSNNEDTDNVTEPLGYSHLKSDKSITNLNTNDDDNNASQDDYEGLNSDSDSEEASYQRSFYEGASQTGISQDYQEDELSESRDFESAQGINDAAADLYSVSLPTTFENSDAETIEPEITALATVKSTENRDSIESRDTQSEAHDSQSLSPTIQPNLDPRTLLRCEPQELTGEWTPEKWDYWLQEARESGSLAEDERALARQGIMTGLCNGEATFVTGVDSKHLRATFEQLAAKLQQQFKNAHIQLKAGSVALSEILSNDQQIPQHRQQERVNHARATAEVLLLQSPVMQYLSERGEGKMGLPQLRDPE